MRPLEVVSAICCLLSCVSCSIKEDRGTCPCRLMLDFSENDTVSVRSAELLLSASKGFTLADTIWFGDFDRIYEVSVPGGEVNVLAWCGGENCVSMDEGLVIPYGDDCPEVYMSFFGLTAEGEMLSSKVSLKKNHCKATLFVKSEEAFPYRIVVRGHVAGYRRDGMPADGEFMYEMKLREDMAGTVTLPRQLDDSLCLEVYEGDNVLKVFTLGRYISAVGYDWKAEHLDDLTLSLDYSHSIIGISIGEWDREYHFNISI